MSWARGVELFNQGLFWEAHEAWEKIWLSDRCPRMRGMIQYAAALVKLRQGNLRGVLLNWNKARANLPDHGKLEHLDLFELRGRLDGFLAPALAGELPDWSSFPRL